MSYCRIHGRYDDSEDGCPYCQWSERTTRDSLEDLAERIDSLAARQRDPGDYECPHCRYRSLRRGATRCPTCHANPGGGYWLEVYAREREQKERAAEAAQRAQEVAQRARAEAAARPPAAHSSVNSTNTSISKWWAALLGPLGFVLLVIGFFAEDPAEVMREVVEPYVALIARFDDRPAIEHPELAPAAAPTRVPEPYRTALNSWLERERQYRVAELADCDCAADLQAIRAEWDNEDPYYVIADLSGDGRDDLAVVLLDRTKQPGTAQRRTETGWAVDYSQFWNVAVAIFDGPPKAGMKPRALLKEVGAPSGSLLYYDKSSGRLLIGPWESEGGLIVREFGSYAIR